MRFQEILPQARKARGLSQEELAVKIRVSRQAVSKWETGDAMPDLPKLVALADALDMSLDTLCGREAYAKQETPPQPPETPRSAQKRERWRWPALCALCILLAAGLLAWGLRNIIPSEEAAAESRLPDIVTASGVKFGATEINGVSWLTCSFVPSVAGGSYTYAVTFAGGGSSQTFPAVCEDGVCMTGKVDLSSFSQDMSYTVTALISNGEESRSALLATHFTVDSYSVSWQSAE